MGENMKAVIYARVSSKEQEQEGFSIPAQLKLLNDYAVKNGYQIVKEFTDVETAKQAGRENFSLMMEFLKKNPDVKTILCEKTDRIARNFKDMALIEELVEQKGYTIIFVKENNIISKESRSQGKFMFYIMASMAKNYINNLSEETSKGMLEKAEQGIYPSMAPMGYKNVEDKTNGRAIKYMILDEIKAPILKQVFTKYAHGDGSIELLVKWAYDHGLRNRGGGIVNKAAIHKVLHSPVYCGMFQWKGKIYQGKHTPLVSKELYNMVQKRFEDQNRPRQTKRHFAYTGLIYCGKCGCSITAELKKGRYVYYHCTEFHGKCGTPWIREEDLDTQFFEIISRIHVDSDLVELIKTTLLSSHKDEIEFHQKAISALLAQKTKLDHRTHQLYRDKLDDKITEDFYSKLREECQQELEQVKAQIARHECADNNYLKEGVRILELCNRLQDLYLKQTPLERGKILRYLLSNCTLNDVTLSPKWRKPFDLMAKGLSRSNWLPLSDDIRNYFKGTI
jgi:DNA invertase Pin-like site-specific DNA recombinase